MHSSGPHRARGSRVSTQGFNGSVGITFRDKSDEPAFICNIERIETEQLTSSTHDIRNGNCHDTAHDIANLDHQKFWKPVQ